MRINLIQIFSFVLSSLCLVPAYSQKQELLSKKHIEVALRMIGHELLLNANDSTSRVLPIIEDQGRYRIQFESDFEIQPDQLVETVNRVAMETDLAKSYFVEVEACASNDVVYSFEMAYRDESNITPCQTRDLPKSCYSILFTLADQGGTKAALLHQPTKGTWADMGPLNYVIGISVALLGAFFFFLWKRRPKPGTDPNLIPMGDYHFDKRNTALLFGDQKIDLTSKEADLLMLLYNDANTTVERDIILKMVWGDEGDYVGRTLDVFISKLRKKLEFDATVKIVNIRGVGYKLVMNG